jgi:hypothetical protein
MKESNKETQIGQTMRKISLFLAFFLVFSMAGVEIKADTTYNEKSNLINSPVVITKENPMPDERNITELEVFKEEMDSWIDSVIRINETAYNQKVNRWYEDENFVTLEFSENETRFQNTVNESDQDDVTEFQIHKIEYLKPNATIAKTTYATKIIYYYAWSTGYYLMDRKSGTSFIAIANLLMTYTNTSSKLVSWVISEATGIAFNQIDQSRPITAETKNKYFYLNKTGAVYISGVWLPRVYIGSRRAFAWSWTLSYSKYGEPLVHENGPKNGIGMPPSNYDSIEKKNHYDDETWILNETQLRAFSYAYVDVYYQSTTPMP